MKELEQKINSLIKSLKKDFYEKKQNIIAEFEKIEGRKEKDYKNVKQELSELKKKEFIIKRQIKKYNEDLKIINSRLKKLRREKLSDEKRLRELERIKQKHPLIIRDIDSYTDERKEMVGQVRSLKSIISKLEKRIDDERLKADELKIFLEAINKSEEQIRGQKIDIAKVKRKKKKA